MKTVHATLLPPREPTARAAQRERLSRMGESLPPQRAELMSFLVRLKLVDPLAPMVVSQLSGGVSSELWLVRQDDRAIAVKRALARLRVKDEWLAPIERSASEARWLSFVDGALPGYCPRVLGYARECGFLAMQYLDPATHPVWKKQLLEGLVDRSVATTVGRRLAEIHNVGAELPSVSSRFRTDSLFEALRIDPYLRTVARRHPTLAGAINNMADQTLRTKRTLVHGDVSPKNILVGPNGPVFLDAECAWWGDPAFDLAFCANHLLLKCLARPDNVGLLIASFDELCDSYLSEVRWEDPDAVHVRAARLLPALFLARADGMSPVEYATNDDRHRIRAYAAPNILNPPASMAAFAHSWKAQLL